MSLINIGVNGLRVQQTALSVTGQNITNASTPGYSRQRVDIVPQNAGTDGSQFRGAGARVSEIQRISDAFVVEQVRSDDSMRSEMATLAEQIRDIDGLLFNAANGLDGAFDQFFAALNGANAAPDSIPERELVLEAGGNLAAQFASMNDELNAASQGVTETLSTAVAAINELGESIALLNRRLSDIGDGGVSGSANPLLDQRDVLLQELSQLVAVKVVPQDNEQISVFVGKGQALVLGATQQKLALGANQEVMLRADNGKLQPITDALTGGSIGGTLGFRESVLTPAMQRLGQLAHAFVDRFNNEHQRGIDLEGQPGRAFFGDLNAGNSPLDRVRRVDFGPTESGSIRVVIDRPADTVLSDYRLDFSEQGNGTFSVRRLSDGAAVAQGRHSGSAQSLSFDGVTVTLGASAFAAGQSYRLSPLSQGAGDVALELTSTRELALASAARSAASVSNLGSGAVALGAVLDPAHPILQGEAGLAPPLLVRFTAPDRFDLLDNTDPTAPVALDPPIRSVRYQAGQALPEALASVGSQRLYADSDQVGQFSALVPVGVADSLPGNGYGPQFLTMTTGAQGPTRIEVPAEASASATAALLDRLPGVTATAYTDVFVAGIETSDPLTGPDLQVAGVVLESVLSQDDLVLRINSSEALTEAGVRASLVGDRVQITDIEGDDLQLRVAGSVDSAITLANQRGELLRIAGSGQGDVAALTGTADLRAGFDFGIGGPYAMTISSGGTTAEISLNQGYASAADIVAEVQQQLDAGFGSGVVQATLNGNGQLRLDTVQSGAAATLAVSPNAPLAAALGLAAGSAQGQERYQGVSVGGQVALLLAADTQFEASAGGPFQQLPNATRGDLGFDFAITGNPLQGDEFTIEFNAGGTLDNRNGLVLSGLQSAEYVGDPVTTVNQAFAGLVEFVGSKASQAAIDQEAAESLLAQSQARQASISGVNLDEEAANLIRHEQGYNAAAQIISVARDVFNVLINAVS